MFFYKLSKKLTRKNLYSLMEESFNEILSYKNFEPIKIKSTKKVFAKNSVIAN